MIKCTPFVYASAIKSQGEINIKDNIHFLINVPKQHLETLNHSLNQVRLFLYSQLCPPDVSVELCRKVSVDVVRPVKAVRTNSSPRAGRCGTTT